MKKILAMILCISLLCPMLFACSSLEQFPAETAETKESKTESSEKEYVFPEMTDTLSRAKLDEFPIANDSMTLEEKRQLCIDFFNYTKSFVWTPDEDYDYVITSSGKNVTLKKGTVYGSLPYVSIASGNVYRFLDYYDEETGIVDVSEAGIVPILFGNQCSISAFWAWGRVCNKADYDWTQNMTQANGFLRVGPYTYDDSITDYAKGINTVSIATENGREVMYESYACLQPADGLVMFTSAGHVIMCTGVEVVRNADGSIDPEKSYITYTDQTSGWNEQQQSDGKPYMRQGNANARSTFDKLFRSSYLPFTLPELIGIDPVEKSVTTLDFEGDVISVDQLKQSKVTSNYAISDVYVYFVDKDGKDVDRKVTRAKMAGVKSMPLTSIIFPTTVNKYANGDHTIRVEAQISTGERVTVYTGSLIK